MKFTGMKPYITVNLHGAYVTGLQDEEVLQILVSSLGLLVQSIGYARAHPGFTSEPKRDAMAQCLVGFGLLAIGEAKSLLLLCSSGLERPARIHLRALQEYRIRAQIRTGSHDKALAYLRAAVAEAKKLGQDFGVEQALIDASVAQLNVPDGPTTPHDEKAALGSGDFLKKMLGAKEYAAYFGWPSLISHGSILALHEVSRAVDGRGSEFADLSTIDGAGYSWMLHGATQLHALTFMLREAFDIVGIADSLANLAERTTIATKRLAQEKGHL